MSWKQLSGDQPGIARFGRGLLQRPGIAFLGTTRPDGSARIHPVAPVICEGELLLALIDRSPKARDLHRDPRCTVHALPGPADAEFWLEAVAEPQPALASLRWAQRHSQLALAPGNTLFLLNLLAAHVTTYRPGQGVHPEPSRCHWKRAGPGRASPAQAGLCRG